MDYISKFDDYISENQLVKKSDRIILGVSGGKDSMVMAELFYRSGYQIILAHCNFNLRGEESNLDEQLVRDYSKSHRLTCFVRSFQTQEYASSHKISIQMAARDLRYKWFEELRVQEDAQCIAIAQHMNDQIETVMLHLTRGTGLKGLIGILPLRDRIIRPLLNFKGEEILFLAEKWKVPYRDDASNFDAKYARNKVRLQVIPKLKEINPEFEQTFIQNIQNFQDSYLLLKQFVKPLKDDLFTWQSSTLAKVEVIKLEPYLSNLPLMYELLNDFQFSRAIIQDFCSTWKNGSGRIFESPTHRLLFDREFIWIKKNQDRVYEEVLIEKNQSNALIDDRMLVISVQELGDVVLHERVAHLDYDKVIFPIKVRKWEKGDKFAPLGMSRNKKVSDYLIGIKLNLFAKEEVYVLENGDGNIMWLMNHRIDNHYKITKNTRKVLTLVLSN